MQAGESGDAHAVAPGPAAHSPDMIAGEAPPAPEGRRAPAATVPDEGARLPGPVVMRRLPGRGAA